MTLSRRHLFGLLAGAAVAPMLPGAAPALAPIVTRYTCRSYGLSYVIAKEQVDTVSRWMGQAHVETARRRMQSALARGVFEE